MSADLRIIGLIWPPIKPFYLRCLELLIVCNMLHSEQNCAYLVRYRGTLSEMIFLVTPRRRLNTFFVSPVLVFDGVDLICFIACI